MDISAAPKTMLLLSLLTGVVALIFLIRGTRSVRLEPFARYLFFIICSLASVVFYAGEVALELVVSTGILVVMGALSILLYDFYLEIAHGLEQTAAQRKASAKFLPDYLEEICRALEDLSVSRTGALVVVERHEMLANHVDGGLSFDAEVKSEVLKALFAKTSPVHDGAVVITDGRIRKVKAILPVKTRAALPMGIGTRHRSAVGLSEKTDAIVLVASEERGDLSVAYRGSLVKAAPGKAYRLLVQAAVKGKSITKVNI